MTSIHFLPFPLSFPSPFCKWVYLLAELISLALSGSWLSCFLGRNVTSLFMDLGCLVPINYGKLFGELWRFVLEWFFFFFFRRAKEETPRTAGKICRHGFQLRLREAVRSNWTGLPTSYCGAIKGWKTQTNSTWGYSMQGPMGQIHTACVRAGAEHTM